MEKEFVPYDRALRLKELGFNEFTRFHITTDNVLKTISESPFSMFQYNMEPNEDETDSLVAAPTFSQAFLFVMQFPQIKKYRYNVALYSDGTYSLKEGKDALYEYLSAESCLDKLIEIVETNEK